MGIHSEVFVNAHEAEASAVIRRAFKNARRKDDTAVLDLHTGNFMLRGEQLVINDPIA
jgi:NAD(P)H-dependent flavin oxidoreductase YrpB (nitropropane dioxygenase family)